MDDNIILWDDQYNNVLEMMKKFYFIDGYNFNAKKT